MLLPARFHQNHQAVLATVSINGLKRKAEQSSVGETKTLRLTTRACLAPVYDADIGAPVRWKNR